MANKIKILICGGAEKGQEHELDFFTSLLVGRSRSADIRLKDSDISGKHFQFVRSATGASVKDLSRNGVKVDGRAVGEGEVVPIHVGSEIEFGLSAKIRVEELPEESGDMVESQAPEAGSESKNEGADFFTADAEGESTAAGVTAGAATATDGKQEDGDAEAGGDRRTRGDFEEALTEANDGETQEMKTRVGSMEEIVARKRQLDRASVVRRWKFTAVILIVLAALAGVWVSVGSYQRLGSAEGPFLENGDPDNATHLVRNAAGESEMVLIYARDNRMKVTVSKDSNTVDVVTFIGVDRDIPFHLEFRRWRDTEGLRQSLDEAFERRVNTDAAAGVSFETVAGACPPASFYEDVFPDYCEQSQRGLRFCRIQFARSMKHELWRGHMMFMRNGDFVYQLRTEIPDLHWKRAKHRLEVDPCLGVFAAFTAARWDSPGMVALVDVRFSDDYLLHYINKELSAERVANWLTVEKYLDAILIRSWGIKPIIQKSAMTSYRSFLERLGRFYNERELALGTAMANRDEKKVKSIFLDAKSVFGAMYRDRRSTLVNNPEVWACQIK